MEASAEPIALLTSRLPSHPRPSRHQRLLLRVLQLATICAHISYQRSSQRLEAATNASAKFRFRDPLIRRQETFTGASERMRHPSLLERYGTAKSVGSWRAIQLLQSRAPGRRQRERLRNTENRRAPVHPSRELTQNKVGQPNFTLLITLLPCTTLARASLPLRSLIDCLSCLRGSNTQACRLVLIITAPSTCLPALYDPKMRSTLLTVSTRRQRQSRPRDVRCRLPAYLAESASQKSVPAQCNIL
jgi:hypothetical protein